MIGGILLLDLKILQVSYFLLLSILWKGPTYYTDNVSPSHGNRRFYRTAAPEVLDYWGPQSKDSTKSKYVFVLLRKSGL
jgi:hypothetical protein